MYVAVTSSSYQPFAFAAGRASTVMIGLVLSMLHRGRVGRGVACVVLDGAGHVLGRRPRSVTVCGPVQLATPDSASEQVNVTVTFVLFQPSAFAAGVWVWPMVGEVLSISK